MLFDKRPVHFEDRKVWQPWRTRQQSVQTPECPPSYGSRRSATAGMMARYSLDYWIRGYTCQ